MTILHTISVYIYRCKNHLETGKSIYSLGLSKEENVAVADLFLLTDKPVLYVANVDEASMHTGNKYSDALIASVKEDVKSFMKQFPLYEIYHPQF